MTVKKTKKEPTAGEALVKLKRDVAQLKLDIDHQEKLYAQMYEMFRSVDDSQVSRDKLSNKLTIAHKRIDRLEEELVRKAAILYENDRELQEEIKASDTVIFIGGILLGLMAVGMVLIVIGVI